MSTEVGSSDQDDPLHAYSYLSLFPRTCRSLSVAAKPTDLSHLQSVHSILKTLSLKEPGRHKEQAQRIIESNSEDLLSESVTSAAVQEDFEDVGEINKENVRKRRPGLGRKQTKFNFNRKISQPAVIKEPTLDIAKLEDPVEFFLAHERLENAKKELRKQSGILTDIEVDINELSLKTRPRRPGIPGRLKATYKHHCYSLFLNDDGLKESSTENLEKDLTSPSLSLAKDVNFLQEASKQNQQSPFNIKMHLEAVDPVKVRVLGDSISKGNVFLDEILSGVYDHLNSDGQLRLLQEQLQIRPMDIDKLRLPKLPNFPKYDFKTSGDFPKPRKSLPDIQAAFSGVSTKTSVRAMHKPSSIHFSASPTPPKSPFANLSSLRKHIMQLNRSVDSFSTFDTDPYPTEGSSPVNCAKKQPDSVVNSSSKFKVYEYDGEVSAVSNSSSRREELQDSRDFAAFVDDSATAVARTSSILPNQTGSALMDKNRIPVEPESRPESYKDSLVNEPTDTKMQSENAKHDMNFSQPDFSMRKLTLNDLTSCVTNSSSSFLSTYDQHSSPGVGFHDKLSTCPNLGSEQHEDVMVENIVETSVNKKSRRKSVPVHKTTLVRKKQNIMGHTVTKNIEVAGTDAQEHEPSRDEVQAEFAVANMSSRLPDSNKDNHGPSPRAERYEKQFESPEISPEQQRPKDVTEMPITNKSKGKSSPLWEQNDSIELRKKQKRKGGILSEGADGTAQTKVSHDDQCHSSGAELHGKQAELPNSYPEELEEQIGGNIPKTSLDKKNKAKHVPRQVQTEHGLEEIRPHKKQKRKDLCIRKSIAAAGTSLQSGVRRSTRLKMRPLEFWRGERFLYGRLEPDSTLPTLIGVKKYATPARQDSKAALLVVPCVDGERYRELIDLAALH